MELARTFQINPHYKDQRTSLNWQMVQFADVVFVDKTRESAPPLVYRLNEAKLPFAEALRMSKAQLQYFSHECFELVGELAEMDRKSKHLILENKNLITYTYLVMILGSKPSHDSRDQELINALQALSDALKMKPKIPSSFPQGKKPPFTPQSKNEEISASAAEEHASQKPLAVIVNPCIHPSTHNEITFSLTGYKERLYEVHL